MSFDTIIRGGTVVTAADIFQADIAIRNGRIEMLGTNLSDAEEIIDASGLLVMPGGIDSHVHLAQPAGVGIVPADDFESGTRSAAIGGNTTVMPFCLQQKGQSLREALTDYSAKARGASST
ncbi:dihydroorotase-like cyclic amidohydrolase [Rhizobium sp. BK313]|nr:dihydroorotase-like cyclic amidohydrolase [Rhizobium sp. BK313]